MGRPVVVTVGPLATADADGVGLSQTAAGAQNLVINGALAAGTFDADSICASQTPGGAGALTIDGALATTAGVAGAGGSAGAVAALVRFPTPVRVYITCAGNNSGRTFTVTGTLQGVGTFGPGVVVAETVTGANANTVATTALFSTVTSVTISGASTGAVTVGHSGVATMDMARRVIITSGGDDTGITFALAGTDWAGNLISETVTGVSGAAASSVLDYLTVTGVQTSGAAAGTLQIGTNGVAGSPWVRFDDYGANSQVSIQCSVSGTANATVQQTMEDSNLVTNQGPTPTYQWSRSAVNWVNHPESSLVGLTTTVQGNYAYAPIFARVVLNSGTGTVTSTFRQAYLN
jgi:hypothetical protein